MKELIVAQLAPKIHGPTPGEWAENLRIIENGQEGSYLAEKMH